MSSVQAIFFDLDDTLFDDRACIAAALEYVHTAIAASLPHVDSPTLSRTYLKHSDAYWAAGAFARNDLDEVRRRLWRLAFADLDCDDAACIDAAAETYREKRSLLYHLYDDALDTLERLHGTYRLAVVTNGGGAQQRGRLAASGLDRYFDLVVASTDLDTGKPEPAIFHHTLSALGLEPAGVWHIGDSLPHDVAGAHNAGLTSVWLNRLSAVLGASDPQPHHEIASLSELLALLG